MEAWGSIMKRAKIKTGLEKLETNQ
jgi:hypothetical protein